jgi:hypothetical protein
MHTYMYRAYDILIHIHIHTRVPRDSTLYTLVNNRSRFEKLVRFGKRFGSRLVSGPDLGSLPNEK